MLKKRISKLLRFGLPRRRPPLPLLVIFHITTRCDMACRHCADDVWGDPENDLPLEDIARFSAGMGTIESLALGGGEPFLRRDLVEICKLFVGNNRVGSISIPSNGYATESICAAVRSILAACPELALNIMLSLDGFQQTHDSMRRAGSFDRVLETARTLKKLSSRFPQLSLSFNSTISNENWRELPSLMKFVDYEFDARLEFNIISGTPRDGALKPPGKTELEETLKSLMGDPRTSALRRLYDCVYREVLLKSNAGSGQVIPCRAGSLVCLIDANGDVRSCPLLPPLGNLRSASFRDIWQGTEAWKQFRSISRGHCTCNNDCFIRLSLMNYWKLPFMMLRKAGGSGL